MKPLIRRNILEVQGWLEAYGFTYGIDTPSSQERDAQHEALLLTELTFWG